MKPTLLALSLAAALAATAVHATDTPVATTAAVTGTDVPADNGTGNDQPTIHFAASSGDIGLPMK